MSNVVLEVRDLKVHFPIPADGFLPKPPIPLKAVDGVSFDINRGETLGVVGESGCGKSTLGRAIMQLIKPTDGKVVWMGEDLTSLDKKVMRLKRKELQIIFQDPLASLNPRMTVGDIIAEPLKSFYPKMKGAERMAAVQEIMVKVGLLPQMINRYPHEFSGGQCQRIGIARAMVLKPKMIVCDEPVSALDVSIQAQIVNLLKDLQEEFGLSLLFISHDLSIVKHVSHRILVLYLGKIMEVADRKSLFSNPRHPYTKALISAALVPDPKLQRTRERLTLKGDLPSPLSPPSGCVFRTRCPISVDKCSEEIPKLIVTKNKNAVACHKGDDIK